MKPKEAWGIGIGLMSYIRLPEKQAKDQVLGEEIRGREREMRVGGGFRI